MYNNVENDCYQSVIRKSDCYQSLIYVKKKIIREKEYYLFR